MVPLLLRVHTAQPAMLKAGGGDWEESKPLLFSGRGLPCIRERQGQKNREREGERERVSEGQEERVREVERERGREGEQGKDRKRTIEQITCQASPECSGPRYLLRYFSPAPACE